MHNNHPRRNSVFLPGNHCELSGAVPALRCKKMPVTWRGLVADAVELIINRRLLQEQQLAVGLSQLDVNVYCTVRAVAG